MFSGLFVYLLKNQKHLSFFFHLLQVNQDIQVKCKKNAKSGTWFARDNIANFLKWCKMYGVKDECMFETEGLG